MSTTVHNTSKSSSKNLNGKSLAAVPAPKNAKGTPDLLVPHEKRVAPEAPVSEVAKPAAAPKAEKPKSDDAKDAKLPAARRQERKVAYLFKRWTGLAKVVKTWGAEIEVAVADASDAMGAVEKLLAKLPDTFEAPKGKGGGAGGSTLEAGTKVAVTEKARSKYEGVLESSEYTDLVVLLIAKGKVRVKALATGTILMLPRGHVAPVAAAAPTATAAE